MSSMPDVMLFLSAAIPFLYSSSLNADTNDGFPYTVGSAGHLGFVVIVPWPLTSRWCATWLELTRHGGFGEVGLFDSFLIVCHALRLLWVRSIDVMTSSHLFFFSSFIVSINLFPVSRVSSAKRLPEYCFLYASYGLCESSVSYTPLGMCTVHWTRISIHWILDFKQLLLLLFWIPHVYDLWIYRSFLG